MFYTPIFVISGKSIQPFPSTSYILKAQLSFSSGLPLDVTSIANKNSYKNVFFYNNNFLFSYFNVF